MVSRAPRQHIIDDVISSEAPEFRIENGKLIEGDGPYAREYEKHST